MKLKKIIRVVDNHTELTLKLHKSHDFGNTIRIQPTGTPPGPVRPPEVWFNRSKATDSISAAYRCPEDGTCPGPLSPQPRPSARRDGLPWSPEPGVRRRGDPVSSTTSSTLPPPASDNDGLWTATDERRLVGSAGGERGYHHRARPVWARHPRCGSLTVMIYDAQPPRMPSPEHKRITQALSPPTVALKLAPIIFFRASLAARGRSSPC